MNRPEHTYSADSRTQFTGIRGRSAWLRGMKRGCFCLLMGMTGALFATTVYVDKNYGASGDGTAQKPFDTIGKALATDGDVIMVYPGTYGENLQIKRSVKIYGYDGPNTTILDASAVSGQQDAISINQSLDVTIEGLRISGGRNGIYLPTVGTLHVRNCILAANSAYGLLLNRTDPSTAPTGYAYNCVFVKNGGSGIGLAGLYWAGGYSYGNLTAFNNIFVQNGSYGIDMAIPAGGPNTSASSIVLDYNDSVENGIALYSGVFGPGKYYAIGNNSISLTPNFVGGNQGVSNQDFRLAPGSPCIDAGNPGDGWLDPDGTRSDLGAFGGQGAQTFYTSPNDGPIVRELRISQGMIPQGQTFTIQAKGAVR